MTWNEIRNSDKNENCIAQAPGHSLWLLLRLHLQETIAVRSIWIKSTLVRIRLNFIGFTRVGTTLELYSSKLGRFHKWTHLVPDRRTDLEQICQVPYKCKAYAHLIRTSTKEERYKIS